MYLNGGQPSSDKRGVVKTNAASLEAPPGTVRGRSRSPSYPPQDHISMLSIDAPIEEEWDAVIVGSGGARQLHAGACLPLNTTIPHDGGGGRGGPRGWCWLLS